MSPDRSIHRRRSGRYPTLLVAAVLTACSSSSRSPVAPGPSGVLAVQVSGLPAGTAARVGVDGPAGFHQGLTSSATLADLSDGEYVVTAGYVVAQNQTWTPQSVLDSVAVTQGDTVQVVIAYSGGPAPSENLRIAGVQLIQSSQRPDGSVPMVGGRDALLRVFAVADSDNTLQPSVRVRLFQGATQVDSVDVPAPGGSTPLAADTASLTASWNLLLPGARIVPGLELQVVVDPGDVVPETDEADNLWPAGAPQPVTVQNVPAFNLRFVPVRQTLNGLTGSVSGSNKDVLAETTRRMMPLGQVSVDVHATVSTDAPVLESNDGNGGWSQILSEMNALRSAEGGPWDYVGIVQVTYGSGIAGLGYVGVPAAVAWDKASTAPGVIAHELGHNFGRLHAPCGNPGGVDQSYPYAGAKIGVWGLDLVAMQLKPPGSYVDLMSYCNPDWISDYNYVAILNFRGTAPDVAGTVAASAPARSGLLVWGRIGNGRVILEPAFVVNAPPRLPAAAGPERIEGFDAQGSPVFSLGFSGTPVADLARGAERHFAYVVPLDAAALGRLTSLRLTGAGLTALRTIPAALRAGAPGATAAPSAVRQGGGTLVRWDPAYPMALLRDAASGEVLGFGRGGRAVVYPSGARVTVELSNGAGSLPATTLRVQ